MFKLVDTILPETKEMRKVLCETMMEMAKEDPSVVYFDCDVMNSIGMVPFAKEYPDRAVNCGIQEANMVAAAAGASATGLKPFTHTFGPFAARRVIDQVYISAAYAGLNVRMLGSDEGISAAYNGGTHMPIEDVGLMRTIPNITVLDATDTAMFRDLLRQTKDMYGVFYIRFPRAITPKIYEDGSTFEIGKAARLREGNDVTIFCSGILVADALRAADMLAAEGITAAVSNIFTLKPIDRDAVIEAARNTGAIVTAENATVINGLGSAVCDILAETIPTPVEKIGVPDRFGEVGSIDYLKRIFHMTAEDIVEAAKRAVARKTR
ncbi:MAG: transketolase family protein [Butyricicoccus pullicaecorum]|nr:transketolase family protein [Butyricicoccus pullicaecorum]